jgi:hypothetical protein
VEHRLAREPRSSRDSSARAPATWTLVNVVYDDVDPALHPWAKLSMEAHLIKLEREGGVRAGAGKTRGAGRRRSDRSLPRR